MKFEIKVKLKQMLKYYDKEIDKYKYLYTASITIKEALKIIELIERKFRVKAKEITFNFKDKDFGGWSTSDNQIYFKKKALNMMIVCHEMSHLIAFKRNINGHSYKFTKIMATVVDYVINHIEFEMRIK